MVWFGIGAGLAVLQVVISLVRRPNRGLIPMLQGGGYPIQAFLFTAVLGAAVYGTVLWLIFG